MAEDAARPSEPRPRLGRGLAALLGDVGDETAGERLRNQRKTPIEFLRPNPRNPRRSFDEAELDELAASIKERGVIQPILARAIARVADAYEIVAGERRWRAAQRAGLHEVPIIVIEAGDREALEIAIVENVQRTDLNALEEASGYAQLAADYGYGANDIARIIGKSRSHVANTLAIAETAGIFALAARDGANFGGPCARAARRRRPRRRRRADRRARADRPRCRAARPAARRAEGSAVTQRARRGRFRHPRSRTWPQRRAGHDRDHSPSWRERRNSLEIQ